MRRYRHNLRFRVAISFATFGALVSMFMAAATLLAMRDLGQRLVDTILTAELDDYFARRERNPNSLPPHTVTLQGYVQNPSLPGKEIPDYLSTLAPGRHDLNLGSLAYRVAVENREGLRYFFLFDTSLQQKREHRFTLFFAAGVVIVILVSALGGIWLVGLIIAPVTELATRIQTRQPEEMSQPLADDFSHDEVGRLANAFDLHLARIRAFMERERAFTADLSHELRTSLAVIISTLEILLADETLSEKHKIRLLRLDRAARDMTEMGTALLLMSREQQTFSIESHAQVADVIDEVVEKHRFLLKDKPVQMTVQVDPTLVVKADRGLLFIATANLVRNAFAYTDQGKIDILLDKTTLSITDSGCGIRSEQTEMIFQRHFRVSSRHGGSGIGLSLVKRICDHYGWKVSMTSQVGQGTTVCIFFGESCPQTSLLNEFPQKNPASSQHG
ncbi:MAG: HAMP domain-containing histidine kinase [Magnetococcales bacterium]|nr:HAMP domain-containing histidine kinase [Magnetococcales bacterium]